MIPQKEEKKEKEREKEVWEGKEWNAWMFPKKDGYKLSSDLELGLDQN